MHDRAFLFCKAQCQKMGGLQMAEDSKAMTTREAAAFLGSTKATLENWRHWRRGPAYMKQGRSVRYRLRDLLAFQEQNMITPKEVAD